MHILTESICSAHRLRWASPVVDQALEVVEEYQGRILKIEQAVLLKPSMKTVRRCECLLPLTIPPLLCYLADDSCLLC